MSYIKSIPLRAMVFIVSLVRLLIQLAVLPIACVFFPLTINGKRFK